MDIFNSKISFLICCRILFALLNDVVIKGSISTPSIRILPWNMLLILSWRRSLSYGNQSTDLLLKSVYWFLEISVTKELNIAILLGQGSQPETTSWFGYRLETPCVFCVLLIFTIYLYIFWLKSKLNFHKNQYSIYAETGQLISMHWFWYDGIWIVNKLRLDYL